MRRREEISAHLPGEGAEWVIDALGCDGARLRDSQGLKSLFETIVCDLGLRPIGAPLFHAFPSPGGVTGLWLLSESHLSCHTFPESGYAAFNLYCCCPKKDWDWQGQLRQMLAASQVMVRVLPRGGLILNKAPEKSA